MLRRSRRKRVSTRMVSAVWFLNVYVGCVLFLFYVFWLFMSICICVYMIVYASAGALRTSLPLELIDNFFSYSLSGPVHSNRFSNENGAVLLRFQKDLSPHFMLVPEHCERHYLWNWLTIFVRMHFQDPFTLIHFQTKTELVCSVFKKICAHTYRFCPCHHITTPIMTFKLPTDGISWTELIC